jgi:hypothetical protein
VPGAPADAAAHGWPSSMQPGRCPVPGERWQLGQGGGQPMRWRSPAMVAPTAAVSRFGSARAASAAGGRADGEDS